MARTDLTEARDLVVLIAERLAALQSAASSPGSADLRRLTGALAARAGDALHSGEYSARILACFQAASTAGAGYAQFAKLRAQIAGIAAVGVPAQIVRQDALRRCLSQMARALSATQFKTRDDVVAAQAEVNTAFGAAEDETLGAHDTDTYRAIVTLHAAVTRDLTTRARPLPRVVTITTTSSLPALVLAQRLYGDAGRADELAAENAAVSPLFMPRTIQALSA